MDRTWEFTENYHRKYDRKAWSVNGTGTLQNLCCVTVHDYGVLSQPTIVNPYPEIKYFINGQDYKDFRSSGEVIQVSTIDGLIVRV